MESSSSSAGVITVAIVVRAQDGVFQPMLLAPLGARYATTLYRLTGCVLRKITSDGAAPCISSLSDLPADIFVFVNVPIETANHMFLEALVEQTMRQDCGVASGILIDDKRLILHSGWETNPDGTSMDRYAGRAFEPMTIHGIRSVTGISPHFFAVRRAQLLAAGGLAVLSSDRMPELLRRLVDVTRAAGLKVVVTPYAVATAAS